MPRPDYGHDRWVGGQRSELRPAGGEKPGRHGGPALELNVAVMVERDDHGEFLIRELQRQRIGVRHIWPLPAQIPLQYDVLFCALSDDLPQRIPWVPGEPSAALILVDDGKAPRSDRCAWAHHDPMTVGTAMGDGVAHRRQDAAIDRRPVAAQYSDDAAHLRRAAARAQPRPPGVARRR